MKRKRLAASTMATLAVFILVLTGCPITLETELDGRLCLDECEEAADPRGRDVVDVAIGNQFTMILLRDGNLYGMGRNNYGQLGDGTFLDRYEPVLVATSVQMVDAGEEHTIFVTSDGTLWGVGNNSSGQLGIDRSITRTPVPVPDMAGQTIAAVSAGRRFSMVLTADGNLFGTGNNDYGQLGDGTTIERSEFVQTITTRRVVDVSAGGYHVLVLKDNSRVYGLGKNERGQLGNDDYDQTSELDYIEFGYLIAAGDRHSMIRGTGGSGFLRTYGDNRFGQLGDGTTESRHTGFNLTSNVAQIAAGGIHSMFIMADGELRGMGSNIYGQLGDGNAEDRDTPRPEPFTVLENIERVFAGNWHTIVLNRRGHLYGFGQTVHGQLGSDFPSFGGRPWEPTPVRIAIP